MKEVPHGQRKCEECTFYHPERPERICSAFRELQNENGDCSMYIYCNHEERVDWR